MIIARTESSSIFDYLFSIVSTSFLQNISKTNDKQRNFFLFSHVDWYLPQYKYISLEIEAKSGD